MSSRASRITRLLEVLEDVAFERIDRRLARKLLELEHGDVVDATHQVLALAFVGPQTAWGYLGIVPLVTALVGYCAAHSLFGIRTCAMRGDAKPARQ